MRRHTPSMQILRAFHAVARLGITVRAADHLNVTPSAVSHQLRKLQGSGLTNDIAVPGDCEM